MSVILRTNQLTKRYAHRTVVDHLSMTISMDLSEKTEPGRPH